MIDTIPKLEFEKEKNKQIENEMVAVAKEKISEFGQLYDLYVHRIYRYLYSRVGNREEAEDLTAQTFLAAIEAFPRYRHQGHFSAWLYSIARRKTVDHFRKQKKLTGLDIAEQISVDSDLLKHAIKSERVQALKKCIGNLPEKDRELLRLRYVAELSFSEMAVLLKRNYEAVKKSLYRLLARLQSQLEEKND